MCDVVPVGYRVSNKTSLFFCKFLVCFNLKLSLNKLSCIPYHVALRHGVALCDSFVATSPELLHVIHFDSFQNFVRSWYGILSCLKDASSEMEMFDTLWVRLH